MKKRTYTLGIKTQATNGHYFISLKQEGKELLKLTGFKTVNAATEAGQQWQEWRGTLDTFKRFVNVQHTKTPLYTAAKKALEKNLATYNAARNKTAPDYSVQAKLYAEAEALRAKQNPETFAADDFDDAYLAVCHPDIEFPYIGQPKPSTDYSAPAFLEKGAAHMRNRAEQRDAPGGERSMAKTVAAFNTIHNTELSEEQGWFFMVLLKQVRAAHGIFVPDDYEDGAAYFGLAGEAAAKNRAA